MKPLWRAIEALAWIAFFVFATLVLALRFWLLPDIERYRGDIVAAIERSVGLPIKIGGIEAGWLGLRPRISLSDVHLYDHQGREVLALPSIRNVVSWRSLLYGQIPRPGTAGSTPSSATPTSLPGGRGSTTRSMCAQGRARSASGPRSKTAA